MNRERQARDPRVENEQDIGPDETRFVVGWFMFRLYLRTDFFRLNTRLERISHQLIDGLMEKSYTSFRRTAL